MTLENFLKEYDKEGVVVLLEGKRQVKKGDERKLQRLGQLLKERTNYMIFKSGNAEGSDRYFFAGASSVDNKRLQAITPYDGHFKNSNSAYETFSLDSIDLVKEPEITYLSKRNKKTKGLIDKYVDGNRDKYSIKAAYIIRDTVKVTGYENMKPASFGIFYDDLDNPKSGGTGHTMDVCEEKNIPVIDQRVWFKWLE